MLKSMGSQRVRHDLATQQKQPSSLQLSTGVIFCQDEQVIHFKKHFLSYLIDLETVLSLGLTFSSLESSSVFLDAQKFAITLSQKSRNPKTK